MEAIEKRVHKETETLACDSAIEGGTANGLVRERECGKKPLTLPDSSYAKRLERVRDLPRS